MANMAACYDCDFASSRDFLAITFSDAEWHNVKTGHDVLVVADDNEHWEQTDDGWVKGVRV